MSILTQILLAVVLVAIVYASFVHNREKYKEVVGILPDFRKLVRNSDSAYVKVAVRVPDAYAETVRMAAGEAGAGKIGNYTHASYSSQGVGRFMPGPGSNPVVGDIGKLQLVAEERIEFTVSRENLKKVVQAIQKAHPYEETVVDIYPLEAVPDTSAIHR